MGQGKSKESRALESVTHFSPQEIEHLRQDVEAVKAPDQESITEDVFRETVKKLAPTVSANDDVFLKRLYAAFDVDHDRQLEFCEFATGLSVFMKGTPEEKTELSFKLYDVDHDGFLTQSELERVLIELSRAFADRDQTNEMIQLVARMFDDLDVDNDGKLSLHEYKLSAVKEPLIVDILEQFLSQHNISNQPRPPSRRHSVQSHRSSRSARLSSSKPSSQHRLSVRLSQAELLDVSHQQQQQRLSYTPTSSSTQSPKSSILLPPSPVGSSSHVAVHEPRSNTPRRLSRGLSLTSLDAALSSM